MDRIWGWQDEAGAAMHAMRSPSVVSRTHTPHYNHSGAPPHTPRSEILKGLSPVAEKPQKTTTHPKIASNDENIHALAKTGNISNLIATLSGRIASQSGDVRL